MKSVSKLLTLRYLFAQDKDKNISLMTGVCFAGITIGTFALMLTLIITNGFEKVIHEKMQGINAQIIISSFGQRLDYEKIKETLHKEFNNNIKSISGNTVKQVILNQNDQQTALFIKGVDAESEGMVTNFVEKILRPNLPKSMDLKREALSQLLADNQILIGHKTAREHNLAIGDEVTFMIPEASSKRSIALKKKKFIVGGIFKIGLEEYDLNFAFANLNYVNKVFSEKGVDQICLKLRKPAGPSLRTVIRRHGFFSLSLVTGITKKFFDSARRLFGFDYEHDALEKLKQRLSGLSINSWKDLYPALVSSLKLEKYAMFLVIALITLVASMNMISLLFMQIQQKRGDIAILKAMGMSRKKIRRIFLRLGMTITLLASLTGLTLAGIIGYALENYPYIELPDVYYISYLPARMELEIFVVVFVATLLLGLLATWIPAQRSQHINIAQVLRQE